jgi:hypothetical protein
MLCEVPGCPKLAEHRHHVFTVGAHGDRARVPANEFYCCADHHVFSGDSWHQKGRDRFAANHGLEDVVERAREAVTLASMEARDNPCSVRRRANDLKNVAEPMH